MKTFNFYGVCGNAYKLDDTIWEAVEDPSDGYRSYLGSVKRINENGLTFSRDSFAEVIIKKVIDYYDSNVKCFKGYVIEDVSDGFIWCYIGTSEYNDYYPMFVFSYFAKPNDYTWESFIGE